MRRKTYLAATTIAVAAAIWACGNDYTADPGAPLDDAGRAVADTAPVDLDPSNPPGITIDKIVVARGESASVPFAVTRASHSLALDIVASNLPAGISVAPISVPSGQTHGTLMITAATTATEGTTTIGLSLLDGNTKIADASAIVAVGPLRAGSIDPGFGANGFVELDVPRSLLAFDGTGALYVLGAALTRWTKDGTRDTTYGPLANLPSSFTPAAMVATDNGQIYLAGYSFGGQSASATIFRTTNDGKAYDTTWGDAGTAKIPTTTTPFSFSSAFAIAVTPTAVYAAAKIDMDGTTSKPGLPMLARLSLAGMVDTTYGTSGIITLSAAPEAPKVAYFDPIGVDHFVLAIADVVGGDAFFRLYEGDGKSLITRLGDYGSPTALAFDPTTATSLVTHADDAGATLIRVGDAGADPTFPATRFNPGTTVNGIIVDNGRIVVTGCADTAASWSRYFGDGGLDPDYRNGTTPEIDCVLATRLTEKYLYVVGQHGSPGKLRVARLIR